MKELPRLVHFYKVYMVQLFLSLKNKKEWTKNAVNERENFYSYITGIEYVITRVFDKVWDFNFFAEYSNDDREAILLIYFKMTYF